MTLLLHAPARPVDGDIVVGVACGPLRPLVLGQVVGLVLDAQGDAGGCQGEEGEAGVAGTEVRSSQFWCLPSLALRLVGVN